MTAQGAKGRGIPVASSFSAQAENLIPSGPPRPRGSGGVDESRQQG